MEIIQQVKDLIQIDRLDSKDRYRDMVYKRSYLYAILRDEGWHLSKIGRLFNRNHATIINALKVHDAFYGRDKIYMRNVKHYDLIFRPIIEVQKDTIYDDVMNCHNTTALKIIKDKIMAGAYDKVGTVNCEIAFTPEI
jgi:hypothetical protein